MTKEPEESAPRADTPGNSGRQEFGLIYALRRLNARLKRAMSPAPINVIEAGSGAPVSTVAVTGPSRENHVEAFVASPAEPPNRIVPVVPAVFMPVNDAPA